MKTVTAFLTGQALTCLLFVAGGRSSLSVGIIAGALTVTFTALLFARHTARLLTSLADAAATFSATWHAAARTPAAAQAVKTKLTLAPPPLTQVQHDVIDALINLGLSESRARKQTLAAGAIDDFEQLFRKAVA